MVVLYPTCRFNRIPVEERVCVLCNINNIEDEMHMLCTYTLYQHIRIEMYKNVIHKNVNFHQLNDEQKLIYLVSTEWKEVSTFLDKAWTMRTNLLYCTRSFLILCNILFSNMLSLVKGVYY